MSLPSFGAGPEAQLREIERLEKRCEREMSSLFTNKHARSCRRLARMLSEEPKPNDAATYQWNGMFEKYCYHNDAGEVTSCP